jgi:formylglycine-generating enzyme required for sulfatase activity
VLPKGHAQLGSELVGEGPVYAVTLDRQIAMAAWETSNAEFHRFCQSSGYSCPASAAANDDAPVVDVSWTDARAYAEWLHTMTGQAYRLPSEAEWEYAARAGGTSNYWVPKAADGTSPPPQSAAAITRNATTDPLFRNAFRLYHMYGNVREWVSDTWQDSHEGASLDGAARVGADAAPKVVRGGTFDQDPSELRASMRAPLDSRARDSRTGFRVVRDL